MVNLPLLSLQTALIDTVTVTKREGVENRSIAHPACFFADTVWVKLKVEASGTAENLLNKFSFPFTLSGLVHEWNDECNREH